MFRNGFEDVRHRFSADECNQTNGRLRYVLNSLGLENGAAEGSGMLFRSGSGFARVGVESRRTRWRARGKRLFAAGDGDLTGLWVATSNGGQTSLEVLGGSHQRFAQAAAEGSVLQPSGSTEGGDNEAELWHCPSDCPAGALAKCAVECLPTQRPGVFLLDPCLLHRWVLKPIGAAREEGGAPFFCCVPFVLPSGATAAAR